MESPAKAGLLPEHLQPNNFYLITHIILGHAVAQLVQALR